MQRPFVARKETTSQKWRRIIEYQFGMDVYGKESTGRESNKNGMLDHGMGTGSMGSMMTSLELLASTGDGDDILWNGRVGDFRCFFNGIVEVVVGGETSRAETVPLRALMAEAQLLSLEQSLLTRDKRGVEKCGIGCQKACSLRCMSSQRVRCRRLMLEVSGRLHGELERGSFASWCTHFRYGQRQRNEDVRCELGALHI